MAKFTTYLLSDDAKAQAEFYVKALGGEILSVMTHGQVPGASGTNKDKVVHLSLVAAGVQFFLTDSMFGPVTTGNAVSQCLEFVSETEAREAFNNLAADGGDVSAPLEPAFWGSLFGEVVDKFGIPWMVATEAKPG